MPTEVQPISRLPISLSAFGSSIPLRRVSATAIVTHHLEKILGLLSLDSSLLSFLSIHLQSDAHMIVDQMLQSSPQLTRECPERIGTLLLITREGLKFLRCIWVSCLVVPNSNR
jgi:hypothetical protein